MIRYVLCLVLSVAVATAQDSAPSPQPSRQETDKPSLSAPDISQLQTKADAGDAAAQTKLGKAFQDGYGVPQSDALALTWLRKAAEQGDASAENDLGIMYRMGQGVTRDKEEAVRWYTKAAKHGSPQAMFNLGAAHYNGEGFGSNEFTAYVWFLLAQDAGDPVAKDAVKRSAASMSATDTALALVQIATMYEKGDELPRSDEQTVRWLRRAAEIDAPSKVRLALYLLTGPAAQRDYGEALELCKSASKEFVPALPCVGYIYRRGLGVTQDSAEAVKWYQKAADTNSAAMLALGEMYSTGEGTKIDRPAAFLMFFRASRAGAKGAKQKASDLLRQMDPSELKQVQKKLRDQRLDPKQVLAAVQDDSRP